LIQSRDTSTQLDALKEVNDILDRSIIIQKFANITDADKIVYDTVFEQGLVNKLHSKTLVIVAIPFGKSIQDIERMVNDINTITETIDIPKNGKATYLTGTDAVNVAVNRKLADEQIRSMILALILVLSVLILIFNSSMYGFLTMIPLFFILMWEPGFLVVSGIPLSTLTITIAAIMVGVGIDYGVHITHRVREELAKGVSKKDATSIAIEKTGLSLVEAAITTIAGVGSILFINIIALNQFVIVVIFMTSVSAIGAALLLPVFYQLKFLK